MADKQELNPDQGILLSLAGVAIFFFIIFEADGSDISGVCCLSSIFLLLMVPVFATKSPTKTSTYGSAKPSSLFSDELNKDIKQSKKRKPANLKDMPLEWKQLKEIYPEAELDEYSDYNNFKSGNWDMVGLKEDLDLMIKRTGKKPDENIQNNESDFISSTSSALRKLLKEKGLSTNGVKAKLIQRLETAQKQSENEDNQVKQQNKPTKKNTKITIKKLKENLEKSKNTETDLYAHPQNSNTKLEDLKLIKDMLSEGLINDDEFKLMKKNIIGK